ncbi:MAG: efflux RND transporter permease subunit [FCB group bacterium]|nr:efflux RND transporter permease subunit [FCB group bacterium]
MFLADISIKRRVMMTMIILSFAVIGLYSLGDLGIDMFPEIEFPFVVVMTIYPGAGPEEVETLITKPIEEEIGSINGVKTIQSVSQEGLSFVFIEFQYGVEVDIAGIDVKEKVDAIKYLLPKDIEAPSISKFDINAIPILNLAVSSPRPLEEVHKLTEDVIEQELAKIQGLASIELVGGREREVRIEADKNALASRGLGLMNIIMAIQSENLNVPSGRIVDGRKEFSIRMASEFASVEELRQLKIAVPEGTPIRLTDVARVIDDFEEQRELARFNNIASVGMNLIKRSDANTVQVAKEIKKSVAKLQETLPADVKIDIARDRSLFIEDSVADVTSNIILGIMLTALVLMIFLQDWQGTLVAAIAMPLSIVSTFTLLKFAGFTLNMMSLMGLAISVGILVANSIVVIENIERYKKLGKSPKEAASKGTSEIAIAVAASTLTNVVVFTPIAFMSGITGQFFRQFGLTVAFATMFSLIISYTLVPMMSSLKLKKGVYVVFAAVALFMTYNSMGLLTTLIIIAALAMFILMEKLSFKRRAAAKWDNFYDGLVESYRNTLRWAISHRKTVVFVIIGIFLLSLPLARYLGSEFMPESDQGSFSISVEMPAGTAFDETDNVLNSIEKVVSQQPEVQSFYTALGQSESGEFSATAGVNLGVVVVQLADAEFREASTDDIINRLRPKLASIPAAKLTLAAISFIGGGGGGDLQIEITGPEMDELNRLSQQIAVIVSETPGLVDVSSSFKIGKPELYITPKRGEISDAGLTAGQVAMSLRNMIEGNVAGKYREAGDEYDIRVRLSERDRGSLENVGDFLITTMNGPVQIARVADLQYREGPATISRKNKERMVSVMANTAGTTIGEAQAAIEEKLKTLELKPGYKVYFGGMSEMMAESFTELLKALALATILTYMLMAAVLESYKNPFIILLTLPLAIIGVILSLLISGKTISMLSLMAVVMLVGIVVNNGILLIDYIGLLRKDGRGLREAILEACPIRLRPIIMTNLATILGMLPLAMGLGAGGEFRSSMAVVSIGGLITSTIFPPFLHLGVYAFL